MRVPFRERDPRTLAIVGTVVIVAVIAASLLAPQLIFRLQTTTYTAEFGNAAGLLPGDPVVISGVSAGRVTDIELAGRKVLVTFRMKSSQKFGEASTIGIKIKTILGKRYLDLIPRGDGEKDPDRVIPLSQTSVPFSLDDLSRSAAKATEEIDMDALKALMKSLAEDTPDAEITGRALDGVIRATQVFNKHAETFKAMIRGAQQATKGLLEQKDTLLQLLADTDTVMSTLAQRREAIGTVIADVTNLSRVLANFLDTNRPQISSLLGKLGTITKTLKRTQKDFNETLRQFGPAARYLANTTGHGPWADVGAPAFIVPDNILCAAGIVRGCS